MAIKIEKKSKFIPYRNAEFIPAYLFIPKELLDQVKDERLRTLPRTLRGFMYDKKAIEVGKALYGRTEARPCGNAL